MNWGAVLGTLIIIIACLVLLGLSVRQAIRVHRSRQMSDETALAMIASVTVTLPPYRRYLYGLARELERCEARCRR